MTFGDDFEKFRKRARLDVNKFNGKNTEERVSFERGNTGRIKRTGKGSDYEVTPINQYTGKEGKKYLLEVKSNNAKLSSLQKKTKKDNSNYVVDRRKALF